MKRTIMITLGLVLGVILSAQAPVDPTLAAPRGNTDPLSQGEEYFNNQDYAAALSTFEAVLNNVSLKDSQGGATFWLGKTYLILNDPINAAKYMNLFLKGYPNSKWTSEGLYTLGRILLVQGLYEDSISTFNQFLEKYEENSFTPNTLYWIAEGTYKLGRLEDARQLYNKLCKFYPSSPKVENAQMRLDMIDMKLRETELLNLLRWSQQESVNAFDEYQRREKAFFKKIQGYEDQIQELQNKDANALKIASLEAQIKDLQNGVPGTKAEVYTGSNLDKLLTLKKQALELKGFYLNWEATHGK